jgi:SAM-dependent methyltransferase
MSAVMLARAAERVAEAGLGNVTLDQRDAQHDPLGAQTFDLVFSRFGVMFFADPVAAFANLRAALRPGGRVVFACWQAPKLNPWMSLPERAALDYFELEPPAPDGPDGPGGPGPFSLADPDHVSSVLGQAGLGDIALESVVHELTLSDSGDLHPWAEHRFFMGSTRAHYLESTPERQHRARATLIEAVAGYHGPEGLRLPGAAWVVSARR